MCLTRPLPIFDTKKIDHYFQKLSFSFSFCFLGNNDLHVWAQIHNTSAQLSVVGLDHRELGRVVLTALLPNSHADDVLFGICNLAASLINRLFYSLIIIIKIDVSIALRNCNIRCPRSSSLSYMLILNSILPSYYERLKMNKDPSQKNK